MKNKRSIIAAVGAAAYLFLCGVCWHSVEEIHYLKSFFPRSFTVAEALDAALIELVKIVIIALPLLVIIAIALHLWRDTPPGPRN